MPAQPPNPARNEVLLWILTNGGGAAAAAVKFGIPANRIRQWQHQERARGHAPPLVKRPVTHPPAPPDRPNLLILPPPPAATKLALPPDMRLLAEEAIKLAMQSMIDALKLGGVSVNDCTKVIAAVTDRFEVLGGLGPVPVVAPEVAAVAALSDIELEAQLRVELGIAAGG